MLETNKVALFDFCETIANFQTADAYVDFVREKLNDKQMYKMERMQNLLKKIKLIQIAERITGNKYSINKRIKLLQLKGQSYLLLQELAKEYYQERIRTNVIPEMLNKLLELKAEGYKIILVSGGYDIYLSYFVNEYSLSDVISTRIGFKNNICTGRFDGVDCLRDGKTFLLDRYFDSRPKYSIAFSDSISDLPFLNWADEGVVVSKVKSQKWAKDNNFNEIIWYENKDN